MSEQQYYTSGIPFDYSVTNSEDLLDAILENCPPEVRVSTGDRFLEWLHGSGLIKTSFTIEQFKSFDQRRRELVKSMGIECPDEVYSCAWRFVRYSGMIQPP